MAKDFDIFLHRHLTECDLIIQSIPFRDGISVTDRMILNAYLEGCKLMRIAAVRSDMEIVAKIDEIIKTCYEKLEASMVMDASADFKIRGVMSLVNEPMELSVENLGTLSTVLNRVETGMIMYAGPLMTKISKTLGRIDSKIELNANVSDILKTGFIATPSDLVLDADVLGDKKKGFLHDNNIELSVDATLRNLCTRILFDAVAGIELTAMVLGTRLTHSLGRAISGITINSKVRGTKATKFEAAQGIIQIMADAVPVLIKLIYPENDDLFIDTTVYGSVVKRYRLLDEMDDLTLEDFDDMTLDEVDYVILER